MPMLIFLLWSGKEMFAQTRSVYHLVKFILLLTFEASSIFHNPEFSDLKW